MRSANPDSYDQLLELSNLGTSIITQGFRGLYLVAAQTTTAGAVELTITQITNGQAVTKDIFIRTPVRTSFLLPISGESVSIKGSSLSLNAKLYALI